MNLTETRKEDECEWNTIAGAYWYIQTSTYILLYFTIGSLEIDNPTIQHTYVCKYIQCIDNDRR